MRVRDLLGVKVHINSKKLVGFRLKGKRKEKIKHIRCSWKVGCGPQNDPKRNP